jgi:hypothetical protein
MFRAIAYYTLMIIIWIGALAALAMITAIVASPAWADWGQSCGSSCSPGPALPDYDWRVGVEGWYYLYHYGRLYAAYQPQSNQFNYRVNGEWAEATEPPWQLKEKKCGCCPQCDCQRPCGCDQDRRCNSVCPCRKKDKANNALPTGVEWDKIATHEEYRRNGQAISSKEAQQALADKSLPNDSHYLRLTIIGDSADAQRVLSDLHQSPVLAPYRDQTVVQSYPANHWAVAQAGFVTSGKPTLYLQKPDGQVVWRQDSYSGPEELAEAIRRAQPDYDPKKDPDGKAAPFSFNHPLTWVAGGLAALLLLIPRKQN